tara:strand:+ start:5292 stop:5645 length:354 start_codon:yes stop_codon:yes gene_type:complete
MEDIQSFDSFLDSCPKLDSPERWYSNGLTAEDAAGLDWEICDIFYHKTILTPFGPNLILKLSNSLLDDKELRLNQNDSETLFELARGSNILTESRYRRKEISMYLEDNGEVVGISVP